MKKIKTKEIFFISLLILIVIAFYWKAIFKGLILFPGDLLVGAYYPWLDYKWGYIVGVPIKNPLISDIFSQIFIWKSLIAESYRNFQWPLWNPYEYAGIPLLANFQSGALNPFNLFQIFLGDLKGWNLMIISQSIGSIISMYFFLRSLRISQLPAILGSICYTFSTFAITWLQFANLGFAMIYLPLLLLLINQYEEKNKKIYLLLAVPLIFLLGSSGHFQAFIFSLIIFNSYFLLKILNPDLKNKLSKLSYFLLVEILGIGTLLIQVLPTYQQLTESIRFNENYIQMYNYGLLPLRHLATLIAPNFFGNPVTGNYWGFFNYHETTIYLGIVGIFAIIWSIINFKLLSKEEKFFTIWCLLSLLLIFDNPLSKMIYQTKLPLITTSAAGRMGFVYIFCGSVLIGKWLDNNSKTKVSKFIQKNLLAIVLIILELFVTYIFFLNQSNEQSASHLKIAIKNSLIPTGILFTIIVFSLIFNKKNKLLTISIVIVTIFELFYYNWKYLPFTPNKFAYPNTEIINYLKENANLARVESERGPLLPPNTWAFYRLYSLSGYDPLALKEYVAFYQKQISKQNLKFLSRYSNLSSNYDADMLGKLSVKYLLALKYSNDTNIDKEGKHTYWAINLRDWQKVYEYGSVYILENTKYKERVRIESDKGEIVGEAKIVKYSPNEVFIEFSTPEKGNLILTDTYTNDWKAQLNNKDVPIKKYLEVFRSVEVPEGKGIIRFYYYPKMFQLGKKISGISFVIWFLILAIEARKTKIKQHHF
ncbi:MAG: hypothetical protein KatS3mg088_445 [Patescibacteria group bacterium]|nr:MAG: hypothetical protein KatS3mg088_445 [Patescibacteria group bacterium]